MSDSPNVNADGVIRMSIFITALSSQGQHHHTVRSFLQHQLQIVIFRNHRTLYPERHSGHKSPE